MDCTVFEWETRPPIAVATSADRSFETRALLRRNLRLVYPVADDNTFADMLRALDAPNDNQ
jgi:hypothetical protein